MAPVDESINAPTPPPLAAATAIASLAGWVLLLRCEPDADGYTLINQALVGTSNKLARRDAGSGDLLCSRAGLCKGVELNVMFM